MFSSQEIINSAIENIAESIPTISSDSVSNAEISISCEKCEYQLASETLMTLHMKKHKGKNNYPCDKCDFTTISKMNCLST